jgi:hypothetical protein
MKTETHFAKNVPIISSPWVILSDMRGRPNPMFLTGVFLLLATPVWGELLDRIVVIIDNSFIITLSDIRKERTIQSAFGRNPGSDDDIADALVERHLVEQQIAQFRDIEISQDAVEKRLRSIPRPPGVSDNELRQAVVAELRRSEFMIERFRQFIRVSDEELLKYYNEVYAPALRARGETVPPAEQGVDAVRPNVIALKLAQEVDIWMADLRRRTTVEKISE